MKKILLPMAVLLATALLLVACSNDNKSDRSDTDKVDTSVKGSSQSEKDDDAKKDGQTDETEDTTDSGKPEADDSNKTSSKESEDTNNKSENEESNALSEYSSKEIEYARVWLQLGDTQDIDELNVEHISAGDPMNPDDKTSLNYPEDVIQLTGSRLAEGSVTYSGNGDGTIKLYKKIPQRWGGKNPAGEDVYKMIVEDTEQKSIDPGDDEKVKNLIEKLDTD